MRRDTTRGVPGKREVYDWKTALETDLAHAMTVGAEDALTTAAQDVRAMSPGEHALVGIGFALLALRAQVAESVGLADQLDQLGRRAGDVQDLTDVAAGPDDAPSPGGAPDPGETWPTGTDAATNDVEAADADAAVPSSTVTPLRRRGGLSR